MFVRAMSAAATTPRFSDFFLWLAEDPRLLAEYGRDPEKTMVAAGLSREQITTVLVERPDRLRNVIDAEFAADPTRRRLIATPRMVIMAPEPPEPEPEPEPPEPKPEPPLPRLA
jgi:hypothetical protein